MPIAGVLHKSNEHSRCMIMLIQSTGNVLSIHSNVMTRQNTYLIGMHNSIKDGCYIVKEPIIGLLYLASSNFAYRIWHLLIYLIREI